MTKGIQFKSFKADAFDYENGTVEGYASTFGNIDKVSDVVTPGAFKQAVLNGPERVRFLWEHDRKSVIGVITEMWEDDKGLYIKAQFAKTQKAQETRDLMKMGAVDSFSIGYRVIQESKGKLKGKSVNFLKEIQLLEVSCVAWPCNVEARMSAIKSELDERFDNLNLEQQALVEKFIGFLEAEQKSDETEYLLSGENGDVLRESVAQLEAGEGIERELVVSDGVVDVDLSAFEEVKEDTSELDELADALQLHLLAAALKSAL